MKLILVSWFLGLVEILGKLARLVERRRVVELDRVLGEALEVRDVLDNEILEIVGIIALNPDTDRRRPFAQMREVVGDILVADGDDAEILDDLVVAEGRGRRVK